jgi:hypothetical protein
MTTSTTAAIQSMPLTPKSDPGLRVSTGGVPRPPSCWEKGYPVGALPSKPKGDVIGREAKEWEHLRCFQVGEWGTFALFSKLYKRLINNQNVVSEIFAQTSHCKSCGETSLQPACLRRLRQHVAPTCVCVMELSLHICFPQPI